MPQTNPNPPDLAAVGAHGITAEEWRESLELLGAYSEAVDMDEAAEVAGRMFALIKRARESAQSDLAALKAENERLKAELQDSEAAHANAATKAGLWARDNASLRERLAAREREAASYGEQIHALNRLAGEARADSRRMDWMQRHHASIWWGGILERRKGPDPDAVGLEWLDSGDLVNQSERFRTLRDAVDAAIAAHTTQPEKRDEAE